MSHRNADLIDKLVALDEAKQALARWEEALNRGTDLDGVPTTAEERAFLERAVASTRALVETRKEALRRWHA